MQLEGIEGGGLSEAAVLKGRGVREVTVRSEDGGVGNNLLLEGLLLEAVALFGQSSVLLGPQG